VLVVSEKGFGKRTSVDEYRITNRGGKGVKTINITEKTGNLVGILDVSEKEDLLITCKSGITLRTGISSIKEAGRATQGVILIRLDNGDEIAAVSKIEEQEINGKPEEPNGPENNEPADDQSETTNTQ
jgi:DNA gyrase subunit A